jgi:hypothetical protein
MRKSEAYSHDTVCSGTGCHPKGFGPRQNFLRRAAGCKTGCLPRLAKCRQYATSSCALVLGLVLLACSANGQTPGTGTVTINIDASPCCFGGAGTYGYYVIQVNGFESILPVFVNGNTYASLAADLAGLITSGCNASFCAGQPNNGQSPYVTAVAVGNVLHLTARTTGGATNYSLSAFFGDGPGNGVPKITPIYYLPTSGPTLTGGTDASVQGYINPKYMIVGVTYAPPGSQSSVTYTDSVLVGSNTTIKDTFSDQTMLSLSVTASGGFPGFAKGDLTGSFTTTYAQMSNSGSSVTINKTTQVSDKTPGASNSFAGLNHDFDVVWLWINPVVTFTMSPANPHAITWNGYGYDANDQPGLDVLPVYVGWLNGDIPIPSNIVNVLARPWASGLIWGPGQGPGITGPGPGTDFANIVRADPFWQCNQVPANCPTTVDSTRFTLSDNQNIVYEQPPPGGQPITQTYQLQYSNESKTDQGKGTTFTQGFGLEAKLEGGFLGNGGGIDFKISNTLTSTTSIDTAITNTTGSMAQASITGPTCTVINGGNSCNPQYTGPVEFEMYQDNQYGTFMFFPVNGTGGAPLAMPSSTNLPNATGGLPYGPELLTATGGSGTGYTWCVQSGAQCVQSGPPLPPSFSLNSRRSCGDACTEVALSSTGNPPAPVGFYPFTVQVTDSAGNIATQPMSVTIAQGPMNVTSKVAITSSGLAYSRVSQTFNGTVTFKNIGTTAIGGPLQMLFFGLPTSVSLLNATGTVSTTPYMTIPAASGLAPGQSVTVGVQFKNPLNVTVNLTPAVYSGSIN